MQKAKRIQPVIGVLMNVPKEVLTQLIIFIRMKNIILSNATVAPQLAIILDQLIVIQRLQP